MSWQKVAELRYGIDESRPGFEDWEETRPRGEKVEVALDTDWPAFPRIEICERGVITSTVKCGSGSGADIEVVDVTGEDEIGMPPSDTAYLSRYKGSDFDTVYLYFHISRVADTVNLDYEYYPEDDKWAHLAVKGNEIYGASEAGRFYRLSDTLEREYDIPGAPNSLSGDTKWAGGRSLFCFGGEHRPAVRNIGSSESPRTLAASLAVTFDGELSYTPDRTLSLSNRRRARAVVVPIDSILWVKVTQYTAYEAVRVVFDGGYVVAGSGREIQVNAPTISDVGIARSVAERIRVEITETGAKYRVSAMGDYDVSVGDTLSMPGMFNGTVASMKRYPDIEKTDFEVLVSRKGANANEQSK